MQETENCSIVMKWEKGNEEYVVHIKKAYITRVETSCGPDYPPTFGAGLIRRKDNNVRMTLELICPEDAYAEIAGPLGSFKGFEETVQNLLDRAYRKLRRRSKT